MLKLHISKLLVLLLLTGFSATYFLQRQALKAANQIQQDNFDYQTREITLRIEQRLADYEQVLLGTKSLFAASKVVNREAFRIYVENLRLENRFPGIQGVGFSLIIKPSEKAKHIQTVRNEGLPNYTLRPEGERDLYTSIIYLEPFTGRNLRAFGYDMYSESMRRKALEQARDLDKATISGKVKLLQETEQHVQAGFLMFVPVYRNDRPHGTLEERRANIVGWVYAPFRMDDLMQGILGEQIQNFDLRIYDGEVITPEALMSNIESDLPMHPIETAQYHFFHKIEFTGHIWTIAVHSLPIFEARIDTERITVIRLAGVLTTLLLAFLITLLSSGRSRALKLAESLAHIAHYDALTNLPNRVLLADRLQQAMPQVQRREQHLVVVFLDLDGFKAINDNHGHKAGDQLLMTVALRMKQTLREGDTLARLGGDEFVAVLTDLIDIEASVPMLTRLLAAAAQPVHIGDLVLQVSASLGATAYPQVKDIDADQLLRQADQAMYQAKLAGKNRYHIFDATHDTSIRVRHESLDRIHEAIIKQEFVLYYQPKVNMRTGAIIGVEALIRWNHPEKGLLSPALFLPEIEDHPLAIELGEWVIDTALTQIELWGNQGLDIKVSVNIGAHQLQQDNFVTRLREILAAYPDIMPSYLELEVLETSALEDITKVSGLIDDCRRIGVSFALDDFGTGYSSLTYLRRLPVALLKIDQSFVRDMLNDPDDLAIIEGIVGLARTFRREVIAEGVETIEHGTLLLKLGCDMAQGYGIARPMPADQLPKWSLTWRPDSAWVDQPLMSHDDLLLLFASLEQRSWIAAIEAFLKGERDAPLPLDPYQSRLSMWLNTDSIANYSAHPAFEAIDSLYRQIQVLSTELCELQTLGKNSEALARLRELHDLGDALIEQLKVPEQKTKH